MIDKEYIFGTMYLDHIEEKEVYHTFYKQNEKIKCLLKIYYGSHNKFSNYHYAYKIEYIPI